MVKRVSGRVSLLPVSQRGGLGARRHVDGVTARRTLSRSLALSVTVSTFAPSVTALVFASGRAFSHRLRAVA